MGAKELQIRLVAQNRRARHDFHIEDTYEAGMVLVGTEVKSLREGNCSLSDAYARPHQDGIYLFDMHIPPYPQAGPLNHDPKRPRKLLLNRREMDRLISQTSQRGYTLVPLRVYFKGSYAKVEIGLARRKKRWDKREKIQERQLRQEARAARRPGRTGGP